MGTLHTSGHAACLNDAEFNYYQLKFANTSLQINTGCPRRNVPDFGRVFLMLKCTDITQNTYIQS